MNTSDEVRRRQVDAVFQRLNTRISLMLDGRFRRRVQFARRTPTHGSGRVVEEVRDPVTGQWVTYQT